MSNILFSNISVFHNYLAGTENNVYQEEPYLDNFDLLKIDRIPTLNKLLKIDHFALIFCNKGECSLTVGYHSFAIETETLSIISPNTIFSFEKGSDDFQLQVVLFQTGFLKKSALEKKTIDELLHLNPDYPPTYEIEKESLAGVKEKFKSLFREKDSKKPFHLDMIRHILVELLYEYNRACEICLLGFEKKMNRQYQITHDFKNLIEEKFLAKRTVNKYAELLNLTPKYLSECVKKETGHSALYHIHKRILREAEYLLQHSTLTVSEITNRLNFNTVSHFSRFFKGKTNVSPSLYRENRKIDNRN